MSMQRGGHTLWQHGLTLVELMVFSSLVVVMSGLLLEFVTRQTDFMEVSTAQNDLRTEAQLAMDQIGRELRFATRAAAGSPPNVSIPPAPSNTTLTLYLPYDRDSNGLIIDNMGNIEWDTANPVQYQYDAVTKRLLRTAGTNVHVLANYVSSVAFADNTIDSSLSSDEVKILLTLQKTTLHQRAVTTTSTALVELRN